MTETEEPCKTVNSKSHDTGEMSKNINDTSLANLKHYEGKWKGGKTRTIRVPITLAEATLEYARQLDNGIEPHDTSDLEDQVKRLKADLEKVKVENQLLRIISDKSEKEAQEHWLALLALQERFEYEVEVVQAENEKLKTNPPVAQLQLPEPADLLNQLKAKRKKATASLADIETILGILEELTPDGGN